MADRSGQSKSILTRDLEQEADQFEFHAIVKLLESIKADAVPLGESVDPTQEAVRLNTHISEDFPTTDVFSFKWSGDDEVPPLLKTNFLGIAGVQGPLPTPYTQKIIERDRKNDHALHSFLDIFNHRLLSLFHRIRKKYWVGVSAQKPEFTFLGRCLRSLLGLSLPALQDRMHVPDRSFLYYTGLLWQKPRSSVGLKKILEGFCELPVSIQQFKGDWMYVPKNQRSSIGKRGHFAVLGKNAILGKRFWDQQAGFDIQIGPMSLDRYVGFLKPSIFYKAFIAFVKYYVGASEKFRLNLILQGEEKPKVRLGKGVALGWTSWVNASTKDVRPQEDRQAFLTLHAFKAVSGRIR